MIPWKLLGKARTPGEGVELRLYQRDKEFSITVDNDELMNSRVHGSEEALAWHACQKIARRTRARVLIGGLGMGFTLRAALNELGGDAQVAVSELMPDVVQWNRDFLGHLAGSPLDDHRVTIHESDCTQIIKSAKGSYDAIMLDMDNGPKALMLKSNDRFYSPSGLTSAFAALRPKGVMTIWSSGPDEAFVRRLRQAGFDASEVRERGRGKIKKGAHHFIWVATRP